MFVPSKNPRPLLPGDIIGFSGHSSLSAWINCVTYGIPFVGISHLGIMAEVTDSDLFHHSPYGYWGPNPPEMMLFESTMNCPLPCRIAEKKVDGVQAHNPWGVIDIYKGKAWHYPLARPLTPSENRTLTRSLLNDLGTEYDAIGAIRAGGIGFSWLESMLHEENLSSLYCSELCANKHKLLKILRTKSASMWSPNRLVRYERKHGIVLKPGRLK